MVLEQLQRLARPELGLGVLAQQDEHLHLAEPARRSATCRARAPASSSAGSSRRAPGGDGRRPWHPASLVSSRGCTRPARGWSRPARSRARDRTPVARTVANARLPVKSRPRRPSRSADATRIVRSGSPAGSPPRMSPRGIRPASFQPRIEPCRSQRSRRASAGSGNGPSGTVDVQVAPAAAPGRSGFHETGVAVDRELAVHPRRHGRPAPDNAVDRARSPRMRTDMCRLLRRTGLASRCRRLVDRRRRRAGAESARRPSG